MKKILLLAVLMTTLTGCATIKLGPSYDEPLKEQVVKETSGADGKVLIVNISGTISDEPAEGFLQSGPSMLDKVLMQLQRAEKDKAIKTVLLKINSLGGGVTSSDILYHELLAFKKRTGKKVYVQMMDAAASGGYYISMAADHIQAHPTTVTGSVGVIIVLPEISELTDKIGVEIHTFKSGNHKDTGSPFRKLNDADTKLIKGMISEIAERFYKVVTERRQLSDEVIKEMKTARIYSGDKALKDGLIDSLGYLSDATEKACKLGGAKKCHVVTYRFDENANATLYSPNMQVAENAPQVNLIQSKLLDSSLNLKPGNYYLYLR